MKDTAGLVVQVASMLLDMAASHVSLLCSHSSLLPHQKLLLPISTSNSVPLLGISYLLLLLGALLGAHALLPILSNLSKTVNGSC